LRLEEINGDALAEVLDMKHWYKNAIWGFAFLFFIILSFLLSCGDTVTNYYGAAVDSTNCGADSTHCRGKGHTDCNEHEHHGCDCEGEKH